MNNINERINSIPWSDICASSRIDSDLFNKDGAAALHKLSNWCKQIENSYKDNDALPFIREAQVSSQDFFCLISLGLYKASASSLRTILESFLYFSYFKDHPVELKTLIRTNSYYITKQDIVSYHNIHTPKYITLARDTGLSSELEKSYAKISAIVHGQLPGAWHASSLLDKRYSHELTQEAISEFTSIVKIINYLMLIIISDEDWNNTCHQVRDLLLKGISKDVKVKLNRF